MALTLFLILIMCSLTLSADCSVCPFLYFSHFGAALNIMFYINKVLWIYGFISFVNRNSICIIYNTRCMCM